VSFHFHPEAERELREAVGYYENVDSGLGYDFSVEVYSAIQRALAYPRAWPILENEIRRALVRRFPYGVLYSKEEEALLIVAIMNLHREPGYWKHRR
jgi:hypothetical protein